MVAFLHPEEYDEGMTDYRDDIPHFPGPHYFRPVFPMITANRIMTREQLEEVAEHIRLRPEFFPQLQQYGHRPTLRVLNEQLVVKNGIADHAGNMDAVILKVGDYLVLSENGERFLTDKPYVCHGNFQDLPQSMFYPIEGERITDL